MLQQTETSAAIDDRMNELTEELLRVAMSAVLKQNLEESQHHEFFSYGMSNFLEEFFENLVRTDVTELADIEMDKQAIDSLCDDKVDQSVLRVMNELVEETIFEEQTLESITGYIGSLLID